ncbi:hypothetical protein SESBI_22155 [Sesbania bispinosa]|nr:hypothetical protein SESBI_22155 [Sesbania bispinosa]
MAGLPIDLAFQLIRPEMEVRVCNQPSDNSREEWFYMYDYCLTNLGVRIPFYDFENATPPSIILICV